MGNTKTNEIIIDPERALTLLDQAVSSIQTDRLTHQALEISVQVLRKRIFDDAKLILQLQSNKPGGLQSDQHTAAGDSSANLNLASKATTEAQGADS